jgi:hypothetical protein
MRTKTLLRLVLGFAVILADWTMAVAGQNPQPPSSSQQPNHEAAREDQAAGGKAEGGPAGPKTQPQDRGQPGDRAFGTITSIGVDRFQIKKMDGTTQTVIVDDQTRYREGGRGEGQNDSSKELQLEDLKPGNKVLVGGRTSDNKEFVAIMVHRVTEQDMKRFSGDRAFGEITSLKANQMEVRGPWQGVKTIVVNEQTVFMKQGQPITLKDLKVGDRVFVLGKESNGEFVAARVITGQFRGGAGGGGGRRESIPANQ